MKADSQVLRVASSACGAVLVAPDGPALAELAARSLAAALIEAAERRADGSDVLLALPGGHTPRACFQALARTARVPWSRLRVLPGDERAVPAGHALANVRQLRETLVVPGALPAARLFEPFAARATLDADGCVDSAERARGLARMTELLAAQLDVCLLGLGEDGHTASLFAGSPLLAAPRADAARAALVEQAPKAPPRRITLTPAALQAAGRVFVLVAGSGKAAAVAAALEGSGSVADCPARLARGATWLLDRAAAARLSPVRQVRP